MRTFALVALLLVATASPAGASEVRQAYTHTTGVPTFVGDADRAYVAASGGIETERSFVAAPGPFVLTEVDSIGTAAIGVCPLTTPLTADGELSSDASPHADCSTITPVARSDDGTWSVQLDPWPANGVAVVPILGAGSTFRVAFDTTKTAVVAVVAPTTAAPVTTTTTFAANIADVVVEPALPVVDATTNVALAPAPAPESPVVESIRTIVRSIEDAARPSSLVVLPAIALIAALLLVLRNHRDFATTVSPSSKPLSGAAALVVLPMLLSEANVYKLGLVVIVLVATIGLHLLVTWAGELSLAQAPLVGLPAFTVAKISADHGLSPIYLLPLAVVVGVVAGAVVGLPALRARGLQVALVTLAAGVAIDRFFFTREWVVGPPGGAAVTVPSLGPLHLTTARALWPVLAIVVLLAIGAAWAIDRSKVGRGFRWVKAHPEAASAFGVPVSSYRALAYALAGAFAGLAGGLTAMWVQRMTPQAFPLSLSFTYLIIVALAGRGFVGGVAAAALSVEGGRLFLASGGALIAYAAPIGLVLTLTRNPAGLNGLGRQIKERVMQNKLSVRTIVGIVLVVVGFAAIGLAWYHAGNTDQVWVQNQELISGGIGGLALVVVGAAMCVVDWLADVLGSRDARGR